MMHNKLIRRSSINIYLIFIGILLVFIFLSSIGSAFELSTSATASNESILTAKNIENAFTCLDKMSELSLPTNRLNSSLQEAISLYEAQFLAEKNKRIFDYTHANEVALDVCNLKEEALKAKDEMDIFIDSYNEASKSINLSQMDKEYNSILKSFSDERFEDTPALISVGYTRLSEVQASQTAGNIFYKAVSTNIKDFFINNWKKIIIILLIILFLGIFFRHKIKRYQLNTKMRNLEIQKVGLNKLIKDLQTDYFNKGKISQGEFNVKLELFKEMVRDIDRQIPLIKERLLLIERKSHEKNLDELSRLLNKQGKDLKSKESLNNKKRILKRRKNGKK